MCTRFFLAANRCHASLVGLVLPPQRGRQGAVTSQGAACAQARVQPAGEGGRGGELDGRGRTGAGRARGRQAGQARQGPARQGRARQVSAAPRGRAPCGAGCLLAWDGRGRPAHPAALGGCGGLRRGTAFLWHALRRLLRRTGRGCLAHGWVSPVPTWPGVSHICQGSHAARAMLFRCKAQWSRACRR